MNRDEKEKRFIAEMKGWFEGQKMVQEKFEKWVDNASIDSLLFASSELRHYGYGLLSDFIDGVISLKKIEDINENIGVDFGEQLN